MFGKQETTIIEWYHTKMIYDDQVQKTKQQKTYRQA